MDAVLSEKHFRHKSLFSTADWLGLSLVKRRGADMHLWSPLAPGGSLEVLEKA